MASTVYGKGRVEWAAGVATLVGLGITLGEMAGGALAKHIPKTRYQMLTATSIGVIFLGGMRQVLRRIFFRLTLSQLWLLAP